MTTSKSFHHRIGSRLAVAVAFSCTLMGGVSHAAIDVKNVPLKMAETVHPNIWFILDDSGSMTFTAMPADRDDFDLSRNDNVDRLGTSLSERAYTINTIYYNPNTTYKAWVKADKTPYTGGTSYGDVYTHPSLLAKDDYTDNWSGDNVGVGLSESLYDNDQIFYVPKDATYTGTDRSKYYRYVIRKGTGDVEQCAGDGTSCTPKTPTGRSQADERTNFATWFSYHRTRIKSAKAGASLAFSGLGTGYRVGFDTIHMRNTFRIPVDNGNGLFTGDNKSTWFQRLVDAEGESNTPLIPALKRAGEYFKETGNSGPYGGTLTADNKQLQCRQNFAILTTDGYWNSGSTDVGNEDNTDGPTNEADGVDDWTYEAKAPYKDDWSNTLADVAMHYWKTDLRTDMDNIVPFNAGINPAFWQHMVTFGISIGLKGSIDQTSVEDVLKSGVTRNGQAVTGGWPDPMDRADEERIDDLLHAAVNGHGKFVAASNPEAFAKGLIDALSTIGNRVGSRSNVSANSTALREGTFVYQASYDPNNWSGDLKAYAVKNNAVERTPTWAAGPQVKYKDRVVLTEGGTFPTESQSTALTADVALYIKGDDSKESKNGGSFRNRTSLLGDIVYSSPVFVEGSIPTVITDKDVDDTVYVGANDGMLHAFNADDGTERFGYVPGGLNLDNLKGLSSPDYPHSFFVDGAVVVSSREQTMTTTYPKGRNILVGALGRGGKGLYALDVTDVTKPTVLWDNTWSDKLGTDSGVDTQGTSAWAAANKQVMGHITSTPFIAKLNNGATGVITSNGLHLTDAKGAVTKDEVDQAALFIVNVETGSIIKEIRLPGANNSLSSPRGWDADRDGDVDYVYAGDLQGNLWKFDLTSAKTSDWSAAYKSGNDPAPMFVAKDADGKRQPISGGVTIAVDPVSFNRMVLFGTGRFLTDGDPSDRSVQTIYGLLDNGKPIAGREKLTKRKIVIETTVGGVDVRTFDPANSTLDKDSLGWYMDLLDPKAGAEGERIFGQPRNEAGVLLITSGIPSGDPCNPNGTGFIYAINAFTGASLSQQYWDTNGDGKVDDKDKVGDTTSGAIGHKNMLTDSLTLQGGDGNGEVYSGDFGAGGKGVGNKSPVATGRISWREILGE